LKASQFYAESCYHYSKYLHENEKIGEKIARLRMGIDHLRSTKRAVKGASSSLISVISRLEKNMTTTLERAEKENNSIYYMKIPGAGSLNDLPSYALERPSPLEGLVALDNSNGG
jgi:programmed cell death 6-interacting protein